MTRTVIRPVTACSRKPPPRGRSSCAPSTTWPATGGEEFVVMLPDATAGQAHAILDRMRAATPLGQTFSAGLAEWDGTETSDELTARADAALYEAKHAGRNRIAVAA
ncbi:GGDEF domain-containing protein [Actinoplanes sp. SE50/110]|uniref:GGDEF domain-containing protein n=1 Tax=unclassified Actinoplanes TaxID=2626549 RepID=UPI003510B36B